MFTFFHMLRVGTISFWMFRILAYIKGYPERIKLVYSPEIGESVVYKKGKGKIKRVTEH